MLWIEKYRPEVMDEIAGQEHIRRHMKSFGDSGSFPHLLVSGPRGVGKTTMLDAFMRGFYGDRFSENVTVIQSGPLFSQGRAYLESNPRFTSLYKKELGVLANFKHIVRWHASIKPLNTAFRVVIFDEADALSREAQNALRRTMERYSATCRFIFVTTRPAALIDPLQSRCLPLSLLPVDPILIGERLRAILAMEGKTGAVSDEDLDLLAFSVRGDLRKAIMTLQVGVETGEMIDPGDIDDTETLRVAEVILEAIRRGDHTAAQKSAETLMIEYGLSGRDLLSRMRKVLGVCCTTPALSLLLAETDSLLGKAGNEYIQVNAFLARLAEMKI